GAGARRVGHRHPPAAGRLQVDVVGAGAPDRDQLHLAAGGYHAVGELGVSADVDGDPREADALDQLGFLVGAPRADHARLPELLGALVGGRALEHAREIVGDGDERVGHGQAALANVCWAAATPAPGSAL